MSEMSELLNFRAGLNGRLSFSAVKPNLQLAWDSVSSGAFKKCKRYYQLSILEGWAPKHESHHLRYGILYHRAGEVYDHKRAEGATHDEALLAALWDLKAGCTDRPVGPQGEVGRPVWWNPHEYLSEERAKTDTKTVPALFRTVVWYLDQFEHDACRTVVLSNGKPAVELSFRYELGHTFRSGEQALHCGHLDKVVKLGSLAYIADKKTTKNTISANSSWGYFAAFSPNNQMTGYTFASKVALSFPVKGVIIDAAQIAKGFSRFERGFSMRTDGQLTEWHKDFLLMLEDAERCVDEDYWPMNDTACDHYGGCAFRGICSKDPSVRSAYLQSDFVRREWDPLKTRGDI